jgi:hypothetical protein
MGPNSLVSVVTAHPHCRVLFLQTIKHLSGRFARLRARGVHINKVCVAVARELAGFVWAIAWTPAKLAQT